MLQTHQNSAILAFCEGKSWVTHGYPHKGPIMHEAFERHGLIIQ